MANFASQWLHLTHQHSSCRWCQTRIRCYRCSGSFLSGSHRCRSDKCPGPRHTHWCLGEDKHYIDTEATDLNCGNILTLSHEQHTHLCHQLLCRYHCCKQPGIQLKVEMVALEQCTRTSGLNRLNQIKDCTRVSGGAGIAGLSKAMFSVSAAALRLGDRTGERSRTWAHLNGAITGGPHVCVHTHSPIHIDGQAWRTLAAERALGVEAAAVHTNARS